MMREKETKFEVGTIRIDELFNNKNLNLIIPDYQRPYVWTEEHIVELINDWEDHFFNQDVYKVNAVEYFLGAIMIYKKDDKYEIIDGQQRLTTLLIMNYAWNKDFSLETDNLNFNYRSQVSFNKIKENNSFIRSKAMSRVTLRFKDILSKLVISVIVTDSEDRAFVLFESQNNRGIPLDEVDFFKSYHLRELNEHEHHLKHFARKFDRINALNKSNNFKGRHLMSLNELFIKQFWRIRFWSKNNLFFPKRKIVLDTFQKNTFSSEKVDEVKLFPSTNNLLGSSLVYNDELKPELNTRIKFYSSESVELPFIINQPIQKGIGFFLYSEKYASIFNLLFRDKEVEEINGVTELVYKVFNSYFINFYQLAVLQYYDKFNRTGIEEFVLRLEHFMGAYRMNRSSIVAQSPIVLLRDYGNILMDIQQAYLTNEILDALKKHVPKNFYEGYNYKRPNNVTVIYDTENKFPLTAARQVYYREVTHFYRDQIKKSNSQLTEKQNWINGRINK